MNSTTVDFHDDRESVQRYRFQNPSAFPGRAVAGSIFPSDKYMELLGTRNPNVKFQQEALCSFVITQGYPCFVIIRVSGDLPGIKSHQSATSQLSDKKSS